MRKLLSILGRSFVAVAVIYTAVVVLAAVVFNIAEAKFTIWDSLWWSFTTATTTGYGDMYPVTLAGRCIAIFLMHFGPGFAFPVMTALMAAKLIVDNDRFGHEEQEQIKNDLSDIKRAVGSDVFDTAPNLGVASNEPTIREVLVMYYAPHFDPRTARDYADAYIRVLTKGK